MKKELDEQLCKEFPNLYSDRYKSMQETCMCWGFDVGDGWFEPIYELSKKLETLIVKFIQENKDEEYYPKASQVKEKYGGLRFYMSMSTIEMEELIANTETICESLCEDCGKSGELCVDSYWYKTLCVECVDLYNHNDKRKSNYIQCSKLKEIEDDKEKESK